MIIPSICEMELEEFEDIDLRGRHRRGLIELKEIGKKFADIEHEWDLVEFKKLP